MAGITLAIDGMGGDDAPGIVIDGLKIARERHLDVSFLLTGDEATLKPLVAAAGDAVASCTQIHHADDVVAMDDKPSQAVRRGRQTSMWQAIHAVREGRASAAVSAGNTGALMAMAKIQLRTLAGIDRPAIASLWPTVKGESIVLDLGANVESNAEQLVQFAIMGAAFSRVITGLERPTIGLLNIGTEELKGNDEIRAAAALLQQMPLLMDFKGFVEGDGISQGLVDVVVTDGFTGNIALKTAEGTARLIQTYLKEALTRSWVTKLGALIASTAFEVLRGKLDPRAHNGGVFLGLNGLVVKSHGGTDGLGFATAIDAAVDMAKSDLSDRILADVEIATSVAAKAADADAALVAQSAE